MSVTNDDIMISLVKWFGIECSKKIKGYRNNTINTIVSLVPDIFTGVLTFFGLNTKLTTDKNQSALKLEFKIQFSAKDWVELGTFLGNAKIQVAEIRQNNKNADPGELDKLLDAFIKIVDKFAKLNLNANVLIPQEDKQSPYQTVSNNSFHKTFVFFCTKSFVRLFLDAVVSNPSAKLEAIEESSLLNSIRDTISKVIYDHSNPNNTPFMNHLLIRYLLCAFYEEKAKSASLFTQECRQDAIDQLKLLEKQVASTITGSSIFSNSSSSYSSSSCSSSSYSSSSLLSSTLSNTHSSTNKEEKQDTDNEWKTIFISDNQLTNKKKETKNNNNSNVNNNSQAQEVSNNLVKDDDVIKSFKEIEGDLTKSSNSSNGKGNSATSTTPSNLLVTAYTASTSSISSISTSSSSEKISSEVSKEQDNEASLH